MDDKANNRGIPESTEDYVRLQEESSCGGSLIVMPIENRILTIRGKQIMIDRDLAELYGVDTRVLNQAVKRNVERFPERFRFQLTPDETKQLVTDCDRFQSLKHSTTYPYAFTEQGVAMLSSVLRSATAVKVSIRIMDAFVAMRRLLVSQAGLFQRIESLEAFRLETKEEFKSVDVRFNQIMNRLDDGSLKQNLGIFFDGQMFDAFVLVEELIQRAKCRIVLIDDYITASLLQRFHKRNAGVTLDCYVKSRFATQDLRDAFASYNAQYPSEPTSLHTFEQSHDRWLIIDDTVYHFGASLKDLGKRWFAVDIITEHSADDLISRL